LERWVCRKPVKPRARELPPEPWYRSIASKRHRGGGEIESGARKKYLKSTLAARYCVQDSKKIHNVVWSPGLFSALAFFAEPPVPASVRMRGRTFLKNRFISNYIAKKLM